MSHVLEFGNLVVQSVPALGEQIAGRLDPHHPSAFSFKLNVNKAKPRPAAHGRVVHGRGSRTQTPSARPDGAILRAAARREAMPLRQQRWG